MLIFGRRISKISLGAIGGAVLAAFGAFCGWILFPAIVALNVNKVNKNFNLLKIINFLNIWLNK